MPSLADTTTPYHVAPTGSGGGSCEAPDSTSIQRAVDAASTDDKIKVCAGTYREAVLIEGAAKGGLAIKGTATGQVFVRAPSGETRYLVRVLDADRVQVADLTLIESPGACAEAMINVRLSRDVSITGNRVVASPACVPGTGIGLSSSSAHVARNRVSDEGIGIGAWFGRPGTVIKDNAVRGSDRTGLNVSSSASIDVRKNEIIESRVFGLYVASTHDSAFTANVVSSCHSRGSETSGHAAMSSVSQP